MTQVNHDPEPIVHREIVLADLTIRDLRHLRSEEPGYAIGSCTIAGTMFHVEALRVTRDEDGCQVGWQDPHDRYADIGTLDEHAFQAVEIPGLDGEWILWIRPFCD